jgi:hypothetical protein
MAPDPVRRHFLWRSLAMREDPMPLEAPSFFDPSLPATPAFRALIAELGFTLELGRTRPVRY